MPPMPPPGGMAGPPAFFFGTSATMASVVIKRAATEAAFWIAMRTTLVGSMMPLVTRLPYSPDCAIEAVELRRAISTPCGYSSTAGLKQL